MKVLLISLRSPFLDSDHVFPHLGILYLSSVLKKYNIETCLEDAFDFSNLDKYQGFDYFAISCLTPQRHEAIRILNLARKYFSKTKVIIGGAYPTFYLRDCFKYDWDYIVIGDGEKAIIKIFQEQLKEEKVLDLQMDEKEMNNMPIPDRSAIFLFKYKYLLDGQLTTTMMTSRGCPFNCSFCENAQTKVRFYNKNFVEKEIRSITEIGFKSIMFFDDLFAVNQNRVEELCSVIAQFGIKFRCFGHARLMTEQIAQTLASAGCIETGVGFESGAQQILDIVKRPRTTVEQNYNYIKICHKFGIRVKGFFILGLPGETNETIEKTKEFIVSSGIDDFDLSIFYPYEGTRIRENIKDYDISFVSNSTLDSLGYYKGKGGQAESIVRTAALSAQEIAKARNAIFASYHK